MMMRVMISKTVVIVLNCHRLSLACHLATQLLPELLPELLPKLLPELHSASTAPRPQLCICLNPGLLHAGMVISDDPSPAGQSPRSSSTAWSSRPSRTQVAPLRPSPMVCAASGALGVRALACTIRLLQTACSGAQLALRMLASVCYALGVAAPRVVWSSASLAERNPWCAAPRGLPAAWVHIWRPRNGITALSR